MTSFFRPAFLACSLTFLTIAGHAQTAIISKARAYLGTEAALDAVKSVHLVGKLVVTDPANAAKKTEATVDIIFEKPDRHRITTTSEKTIEITGLNGYDGWQRVEDVQDKTKWRQYLASAQEIKRIRANVWENVSFFRGIETRGGRIEVMESTTIDGIACAKIAFIYAPNIIFYRFFNPETGKLVQTETEGGSVIREEGEMMVSGIRFPKRIVTTNKDPKTKTPVVTITFDQIKVNETFPDSLFAIPSFRPN